MFAVAQQRGKDGKYSSQRDIHVKYRRTPGTESRWSTTHLWRAARQQRCSTQAGYRVMSFDRPDDAIEYIVVIAGFDGSIGLSPIDRRCFSGACRQSVKVLPAVRGHDG